MAAAHSPIPEGHEPMCHLAKTTRLQWLQRVAGLLGTLRGDHPHASRAHRHRNTCGATWPEMRAINGIHLTKANYSAAVQVLNDRHGRKDLFIDDHIDSLLATEPIELSSQLPRLQDLYEQIWFRADCLDSLGMLSAEYVVVLNRVLIARGSGYPVP